MKLTPIASNMTEVETNGYTVLFSYSTPVAASDANNNYRTEKHWSMTTSRHINKWLNGASAVIKEQSFFDNLVLESK